MLTAKRGGARRFARIDTALALLRTLRAAAVEVRLADAAPLPPRPPRGPTPEPPRCPLSIRRAKACAVALFDALEVGETWDAYEA